MKKTKRENGSMAVYVSIVLLSMLFILVSIYITSNTIMKTQIKTAIGIKQSYEVDNSRASDIYNSVNKNLQEKYVYTEDFDTMPTYKSSYNTQLTHSGSTITLTSTGIDPMIFMYNITSFNPKQYSYIDVRYRVITGNDKMEFFMIENPSDQTYSVSSELTSDGQWHVLTINLTDYPNVMGRENITGWRWDWVGGASAIIEVDYIKIRK